MLKKGILSTLVFGLLTFGIHTLIMYPAEGEAMDWTYAGGYLLLLLLTIGLFAMVYFVVQRDHQKAGWAFLAGSTMKMFLCLGFLAAIIVTRGEDAYSIVVQFLVAYFVFLGFELFWVLRLLRR